MKREIAMILVIEFLIAVSLGILGPFYAVFIDSVTNSSVVIGYAYAVFWITVGISSPFMGFFSDKYNKSFFLVLAGLLSFVVSVAFPFVSSVLALMFLQVLSGLATSAFNPIYRAVIAGLTTEGSRAMEYGLLESVSSISYGVAVLAGAFVVSIFGINILFVFSGLFQLATSFIMAGKGRQI